MFNLKSHQLDIDKIHLYTKDPNEAKYQLLINKRKNLGLKHFNDSKAVIEYSNYLGDIYENIEEYNPNKKRKMLIVFDDIVAGILSNKQLNPIPANISCFPRRLLLLCLEDVLKTSWKTKKCYTEDVFKKSPLCLHQDKCLLV